MISFRSYVVFFEKIQIPERTFTYKNKKNMLKMSEFSLVPIIMIFYRYYYESNIKPKHKHIGITEDLIIVVEDTIIRNVCNMK